MHPALHPLFRIITGRLQRRYDLNHVMGGLDDWHLLRAIAKRPTVLTVALERQPQVPELLDKVDCFVVEWPGAQAPLAALGIDAQRIRLIYPPADLDAFAVAPPPDGPFTAVFASSPDRAQWLEARGVHLILDAAALRPQVQFLLCWRPWGDSLARLQQMIAQRQLDNVRVEVGRVGDMADVYRRAHVTLFCMTDRRVSKPAPNSVVESMACGRPVIVTPMVGLADLIAQSGAGRVVEPDAEHLARALDDLERDWSAASLKARQAAETHFDQRRFIESYTRVYKELLA